MPRTGPPAARERPPGRLQTTLPEREISSSQVAGIIRDARRQDLLFPRDSGRLEAFELLDHRQQRVATFAARIGGEVLPFEQEAHEILPLDRFDLATQPSHGVSMDAREQMPFAPFFIERAGREAAAHHVAFRFETRERRRHRRRRQRQRPRNARNRQRAKAGKPRPDDFDERIVFGPFVGEALGAAANAGASVLADRRRARTSGVRPAPIARRVPLSAAASRGRNAPALRATRASRRCAALRRRSRRRDSSAPRAFRRRYARRATLRRARRRWRPRRARRGRRWIADRSSAGRAPPACGALRAARRRETRRDAPTESRPRAATAPAGRG